MSIHETVTNLERQATHAQLLVRELQIERERLRRLCRTNLVVWCTEALKRLGQKPARHHRLILSLLADASIDRLMIFMPPGSAKSTYASILFPPWFIASHPNSVVLGASHGSDLAYDFSLKVLNVIREHQRTLGYGLLTENIQSWMTDNGCQYHAAGAGGSVTGRRADVFLIDDPFKGFEEAQSKTIRDKVWEWYRSEIVTRLKPGGRIILIMTRWHEDDLAGRLLENPPEDGKPWRVLSLPAIAETHDELGRKPGDPLWPEYHDLAFLRSTRADIGERNWASLYQQRPAPPEGALFKVHAIPVLDVAPACGQTVRGWDLAATSDVGARDPDYTVGVKLARMTDGRFCVLDVLRLRGGPQDVLQAIKATASQDGKGVAQSLPQDPGQAGKSQVTHFVRELAGYPVRASPEGRDAKDTRAAPVASQANVGNLCLVRAPWNRAFLDELAAFPSGSHDDQVDGLARAFGLLIAAPDVPKVGPVVWSRPRQLVG